MTRITTTTRRVILGAAGLGVTAAPLLATPGAFARFTTKRSLYSRARFRALKRKTFRLEGPTRSWKVRLTRVGNLPHTTRADPHSFALTFTCGSRGPEQGSYVLRRPGFRATTLFLVPSDAERRTYEAVILRKPRPDR